MKKLLILLISFLSLTVYAQEEGQKDAKKQPTKYEILTSKAGILTKYEDIRHEKIYTTSNTIHTCIRIVYGSPNRYFYVLTDNIKSFQGPLKEDYMAMIEYSDLIEVNRALDKMSAEIQADVDSKPYNLVNMFSTVDNFSVGYRTGFKTAEFNNDVYYFIQLEEFHGYYKISKGEKMIKAFKTAQEKIEELKAKE